jgi:hypothetical protein
VKSLIVVIITTAVALAGGLTMLALPSSWVQAGEGSITATGCDQGPATATPSSDVVNLDTDADHWGIFCEGAPAGLKAQAATPSVDGISLHCAITGGAPYSNVHCYRNLVADPFANKFELEMLFWFSPTTCNNQGAPSVVQALEFTMSKWQQGKRYEFALQWQNVGEGGPQWRYWDPNRPEADRWVSFNPPLTQCLQGGFASEQIQPFALRGEIVDDQVHYTRFTISNGNVDAESHILDITVAPASAPSESDRLALAVQLDGNAQETPYDFYLDRVHFFRNPTSVYIPLIARASSAGW